MPTLTTYEMQKRTKTIPFTLILSLLLTATWAQEKTDTPVVDPPREFTSTHQITINGTDIPYRVVAGEMHLKNSEGHPTGALWSTAYLRTDVEDTTSRPVTFIFNGGPGSASLWLHMGLFGPRLVRVDSEAKVDDGAAPYPMVDNPNCLLDMTDLVFVDPIGTGYSKIIGEGKPEDFWGLNEDANSLAQFIRLWITKHQRWNAPKFIAGESYGTTRAAAIAEVLEGNGQNVALNGLIMISQAMDYTGSTPRPDNLIAYITYLPTMAATAWYHQKAGTGKPLEDFLAEARTFAYEEYAPALLKGYLLSNTEREQIAGQLAYFTGLDTEYILRSNLRILTSRFRKELLREAGLTVGALDSRYTMSEPDGVAERPTLGDAASNAITSAYTAALNSYFAKDLGITMERPYLTSGGITKPWNYRTVSSASYWEPSYVNTARRLSNALRRNGDLRVLVANGYYDLITPFFDAEYTLSRHGIDQERIQMTYYEAGHMMYTHQEDFAQLSTDIRQFLQQQLGMK